MDALIQVLIPGVAISVKYVMQGTCLVRINQHVHHLRYKHYSEEIDVYRSKLTIRNASCVDLMHTCKCIMASIDQFSCDVSHAQFLEVLCNCETPKENGNKFWYKALIDKLANA